MLINPKKILVVMMGGTIDSAWDGTKDAIVPSEHSFIPNYFKNLQSQAKLYEEMEFIEVCMKDSRSITREDRMKVLATIEESDAVKVIITHGVYTMPNTAKYLKLNLQRKDQTIILTGAMTPLKGFNFPDSAAFNLGFAMVQAHSLSAGIYICMNARVFTVEKVDLNMFQNPQPQAILLDTQQFSSTS